MLGVATLLLQPESLHRTTFFWLFWSGLIGFGVGDLGLYLAYARIGSRITILITFCLAPIIAAVVEWILLGTTITWPEMLGISLIVLGVSWSLKPSSPDTERYGNFTFGICMALVSACGQGMGAVLTRLANDRAAEIGLSVPALSQAFQRIIPGVAFAGIFWLVMRAQRRQLFKVGPAWKPKHWGWITCTAIFGPVVGVVFYQKALETTASAIVLAVVAATPIVLMPFAYLFEKDRPSRKAIIGAVIAVMGMAGLAVYRQMFR